MNNKFKPFLNADSGSEGTDNTEQPIVEDKPKEQTFFTQEELNEMIDRRLARERRKFEDEKQKLEKLSQMTATEREAQIRSEQEQKLQEILEKYEQAEAVNYATTLLTEYGLSNEFKNMVAHKDKEVTMANVKILKSSFEKAVQEKVKSTLAGNALTPEQPKDSNTTVTPSKKMTLAERQMLWNQQNQQ